VLVIKLKLILFYINFTVTAQKTESSVGTQDRFSPSLRKHLGENQVPVRETSNKQETFTVPAEAQKQSPAHRSGFVTSPAGPILGCPAVTHTHTHTHTHAHTENPGFGAYRTSHKVLPVLPEVEVRSQGQLEAGVPSHNSFCIMASPRPQTLEHH
jgi:hypothetical protein